MTKKILETNLKEVKGIKIVCSKCGAYWFVPLKGLVPDQCISCKASMPDKTIFEAVEYLSRLINSTKEFDFNAYIEIEEE